MSRELPIILDNESVWAILAGRKTQLRRVIKPQPDKRCRWMYRHGGEWLQFWLGEEDAFNRMGDVEKRRKPRYLPGDLLWVKEAWRPFSRIDECACYEYCECPPSGTPMYAVDYGCDSDMGPWKSPVSMPKKHARLWLRVTDIRVEQLQDISNGDIRREGVASFGCVTHSLNIEVYWNKLNAKRGYPWKDNPWVWVYEFNVERMEK